MTRCTRSRGATALNEKDVIVWNHLTSPTLFAGQRLELTVPAAKSNAAAKGGKPGAQQSTQRKPATAKAAAKTPPRTTANGKVVAAAR